jgi:hypothetical protein
MRVRINSPRKHATCLVCGIDVGLFRRLTKKQFCCDGHEQEYLAKLGEIGVTRLHTANPRLDS